MQFEDFMAFYQKTGRPMTWRDAMPIIRKRYRVTEVKFGTGDKQSDLFYLHELSDPKGERFQATAISRDGIEWTLARIAKDNAERIIAKFRQDAHDLGQISWFDIRYGYENEYGYADLRENPDMSKGRRNNLESSRCDSNPRVRLSGAICERDHHNYQWMVDDLFDKMTIEHFDCMGTPEGLVETIHTMCAKLGDADTVNSRALSQLSRDDIAMLRATQPPPKPKR